MPIAAPPSRWSPTSILRAIVALGVGLFLEFVAATLISPVWAQVGTPARAIANAAIGALFAFAAGWIVALVAGVVARKVVIALIVIVLAYAALLVAAEVMTALVLVVVLPAATILGLVLETRRRARGPTALPGAG